MQENIAWTADGQLGKALLHWWKGLEEDRASRATLRRCATLNEIVLSDAYQRFYRYMLACGWPKTASDRQRDRLAAIAGLLAHVKTEDTERMPITMSELNGDKPSVSELRFRNLLKADTTEDLYIGLRRVLPLINHRASIVQLAIDIFYWGDETKKRWAYSYRWPTKKPV